MATDLIPEGYYRAAAVPVQADDGDVWVQFGETKDGNPQVAVQFAILDGPQAGRRLTWFGYFTEKSIKRTIQGLRLCGFRGDDLAALTSQAINQEVSITVEHSEWDGKVSAKVAWVNAPGGGMVKLERPMNKDQIRIFGAKLKGHVRAVAEVRGQPADAPATSGRSAPSDNGTRDGDALTARGPAPPPPDDEGIPF